VVSAAEKAASNQAPPQIEQVVVTGSRIAQAGYNTPSPVSVTAAAAIASTGQDNLYNVLNQSPAMGVGVGPSSVDQYNGEVGASFINLRGMGTNRTLVLVDGQRRVNGSTTTSAVDLSSIPANMVDRIEVVTGGAAAVYGADAVSGAVNVILKDQADGLEFNAREGISSRGDTNEYTVGVLGGGELGQHGHLTIGVSFNHDDPLYDRQRGFAQNYVNLEPNPAYTNQTSGVYQNIAYNDTRFVNTTYSGAFAIGSTRYTYNDGVLRPLQNNSLVYGPDSYLGIGGDGFNGADFNGMLPSITVGAALVHFTYELFPDVTLTSDIQFSVNHTNQELQPLFGLDYPISINNPYVPASVAALMKANGMTTLTVGRTDVDQGLNARNVQRETFTMMAKLDGQITPSISWSTFAQYGQFDNRDEFTNERITANFNNAINVIEGPTGPECASATARAAGCVPLNLFGEYTATPAALAYIHYNPVNYTTNTQTVAGGQIAGDAFTLPAGPVAFSAGAEYRKETTQVLADGLASTGQLFYSHGGDVAGQFTVEEEYGEVLVPILSNDPFAESLTFNGAVRESEYTTIGNTFTWKAGLVYAPVDDIHFRLTQSRSVRAPNLSELYSSGAQSTAAYLDPCDASQINATPNRAANCHALGIPAGYTDPLAGALRYTTTEGNPDLKAETSDSTTIGAVFQPSFVDGLNASVDYYVIPIKGAINTLPVNQVLSGCYDGATPNAQLCNEIVRAANGGITTVNLQPLNIGALVTRGLDMAVDYHWDAGQLFGDPLRLGLSFTGNYDFRNEAVLNEADPADTQQYAGEDIDPKFRGNLTWSAAFGQWGVNWKFRYISATQADLNDGVWYRSDNDISERFYNDLYVTFDVNNKLSFGGGVNNIFNVNPPFSTDTYTGNGNGSLYDNIGTYFYMDVDWKT